MSKIIWFKACLRSRTMSEPEAIGFLLPRALGGAPQAVRAGLGTWSWGTAKWGWGKDYDEKSVFGYVCSNSKLERIFSNFYFLLTFCRTFRKPREI